MSQIGECSVEVTRAGCSRADHVQSFGPLAGLRILILFLALSVVSLASVKASQLDPRMRTAVKAACLYNITKYVTWPKQTFSDAKAPYVIGIMGDDRLAKALKKIVKGKSVKKRALVVRVIEGKTDGKHADSMRLCHVVFLGEKAKKFAGGLNAHLKDTHVLTVGNFSDFCTKSGLMELQIKGGKLKLRVNLGKTKGAKLKVSAKLLRQAEIVP